MHLFRKNPLARQSMATIYALPCCGLANRLRLIVNAVLAAFAGKEEQLLAKYQKKYAKQEAKRKIASVQAKRKEQLVELVKRYEPQNLPKVDSVLKTYAGREVELLTRYRKKYASQEQKRKEEEAKAAEANLLDLGTDDLLDFGDDGWDQA